jgi:RNA polymerase sigma-70 factor (ECF subfamily)
VQRDLVERAQRGDREAFGILAEQSIGHLFSVAQLMLRDSDLARDAVQEALILTWRDLRALRDPDRFTTWMHRILVRSVYRVATHERRQAAVRLSDAVGDRAVPDASRALEDRDQIDRGFRRLKPELRAALVVHHYLGLTYDEAAEVLGVPAGTVKSRLNRATTAMRAELDAEARSRGGMATETIR